MDGMCTEGGNWLGWTQKGPSKRTACGEDCSQSKAQGGVVSDQEKASQLKIRGLSGSVEAEEPDKVLGARLLP